MPSTLGGGQPNPLAQELREVLARMASVAPNLAVTILDPDRDRQEAEQLITDFATWPQEVPKANHETFRWLFEEYRVQVFAQELGTAQPVSVKRLEALIDS